MLAVLGHLDCREPCPGLASFACGQSGVSRESAVPARDDLCGAPGCDLHPSPCAHSHGHTRPAPGPTRTGSRFLPEAAAAGGISDLLMKRSDCAAGACQAEMSARRDWITLWPASLRSLQTAAAPRSTISFSSCCRLPPPRLPPKAEGGGRDTLAQAKPRGGSCSGKGQVPELILGVMCRVM